ncbi:hypothetical protein GOL85_13245 [Sinorhizobium medicae]|nr:hypothetical protein [Sinorhizobium medicae]
MPKNTVQEWDTTASNNTDVGGIGIQGTNAVSNFDNGLRTVMSQMATYAREQVQGVPTRTAMKAVDTTKFTVAYLKEAGREGAFKWTAGDFSTQITADTQEGVYVKADAIAATSGAWVRVGDPTVYHFGGSASANSAASISGMAAALGYVRFPAGATKLGANLTIDVPVYFQDAAYVTVDATFTLTLTEVIDSPKQHIFRGSGSVSLASDSDSGENARQVHVSWFGAFVGKSTDQAPAIQKAFDAVGNLRESVIRTDVGNYHIESGMTVTRGAWLLGEGTRRTVFRVASDGYSVFTTGATACRFTDFQFEHHSSVVGGRVSPWITIDHDFCEIERIFAQEAFNQIIIGNNGSNAKIRDFNMVWRTYPVTAGSAGILVRASGVDISGVFSNFSTGGPVAIIEVGTGASGNVSAPRIDNVTYVCASTGVLIHGDSISVSRGRITNINYRGVVGSAPQAIKFITSGTGIVFGFTVDGVTIASTATAGITFEQNSSGTLKEVSVSDVYDSGTTGNGIEFIRTAGTLDDINIGPTVNVKQRVNPYVKTGTSTNIRISAQAERLMDGAKCVFRGQLADDGVLVLDLKKQVFLGHMLVSLHVSGAPEHAAYSFRAAGTPFITAMTTPTSNLNATTGVLTGTTGTDTKATVSVADGVIYVENRLGGNRNVAVTIMSGLEA